MVDSLPLDSISNSERRLLQILESEKHCLRAFFFFYFQDDIVRLKMCLSISLIHVSCPRFKRCSQPNITLVKTLAVILLGWESQDLLSVPSEQEAPFTTLLVPEIPGTFVCSLLYVCSWYSFRGACSWISVLVQVEDLHISTFIRKRPRIWLLHTPCLQLQLQIRMIGPHKCWDQC